MVCSTGRATTWEDFWGNLIPFSYLFEIDTDAATFNRYQVISDQLTALVIPEETASSDWDSPTDKVTNIQLSSKSLRILRGTTATLDAFCSALDRYGSHCDLELLRSLHRSCG